MFCNLAPIINYIGWKSWYCLPTNLLNDNISSVQSLSHVQLFATPWTATLQDFLSITNSQSLFKLMSFESVVPSNNLILCCSLLLPSIFPRIRVFSNESVLRIRWPKYWSFSFSISPSNEYSGLISIMISFIRCTPLNTTKRWSVMKNLSLGLVIWRAKVYLMRVLPVKWWEKKCSWSKFKIGWELMIWESTYKKFLWVFL